MEDFPLVRRRGAPRRATSISCEAVALDGFSGVGGQLREVSTTGALLEARMPLGRGEELVLSFRAPGTRLWISAVARVLRGGREAGLQITEIDPVEHAILDGALARLPLARGRAPIRDFAEYVATWSGFVRARVGY